MMDTKTHAETYMEKFAKLKHPAKQQLRFHLFQALARISVHVTTYWDNHDNARSYRTYCCKSFTTFIIAMHLFFFFNNCKP